MGISATSRKWQEDAKTAIADGDSLLEKGYRDEASTDYRKANECLLKACIVAAGFEIDDVVRWSYVLDRHSDNGRPKQPSPQLVAKHLGSNPPARQLRNFAKRYALAESRVLRMGEDDIKPPGDCGAHEVGGVEEEDAKRSSEAIHAMFQWAVSQGGRRWSEIASRGGKARLDFLQDYGKTCVNVIARKEEWLKNHENASSDEKARVSDEISLIRNQVVWTLKTLEELGEHKVAKSLNRYFRRYTDTGQGCGYILGKIALAAVAILVGIPLLIAGVHSCATSSDRFTASDSTGSYTYRATGNGAVKLVKADTKAGASADVGTVSHDGNVYKTTAVGEGAFAGSKARSVTLGKSVRGIGKRAFENADKLEAIVLKSKKITAESVRGSLEGSKVKIIEVNVGGEKANRDYVRKYRKAFAKKNSGREVNVR